MPGQFFKTGDGAIHSNFAENQNGMLEMIDAYYSGEYNSLFGTRFTKSAGDTTYWSPDMFNAIFGKEISIGMFMSKNGFGTLPAKPYQHEGVRIAYQPASYGTASANDVAAGGPLNSQFTEGQFVGIGATTPLDGAVPESVQMPIKMVRQPTKEVPFRWDAGTALNTLENKDDVASMKEYAKAMAQTYSDIIDKTLFRPVHVKQPRGVTNVGNGTAETSLNSIQRSMAAFSEVGKTEGGVAITKDMVSAYGGADSDLYSFRGTKASVFDGNVIDLEGSETLQLDTLDKLWFQCMMGWDNNGATDNKVIFASPVAMYKLSSQMKAHNVLTESVFVQRDFNGVKTVPGRAGGILLNSYNNVVLMPDQNIAFDYTANVLKPSVTEVGDVILADLDHMYMRVAQPVRVWSNDNPAIVGKFQNKTVMNSRMELGTDKYICHGRIVGAQSIA